MRRLTLLLVDDHPALINAARRHLRKLPWLDVVGTAANGAEAISACQQLHPDAVLMDLTMPLMGGLDATKAIKLQANPPYVALASHYDDSEHRQHALMAGADAFISKLDYLQDMVAMLEALANELGIETDGGATPPES